MFVSNIWAIEEAKMVGSRSYFKDDRVKCYSILSRRVKYANISVASPLSCIIRKKVHESVSHPLECLHGGHVLWQGTIQQAGSYTKILILFLPCFMAAMQTLYKANRKWLASAKLYRERSENRLTTSEEPNFESCQTWQQTFQ